MNPLFHTDFSISDSLIFVRKSVLIYETIILLYSKGRGIIAIGKILTDECESADKDETYRKVGVHNDRKPKNPISSLKKE